MPPVTLELIITQRPDRSTEVELHGRGANVSTPPCPIILDVERLRTIEADVQAYGRELRDMVLGQDQIRSVWNQAVGFVGADRGPIRVRLFLRHSASGEDVEDRIYHLRWEYLCDHAGRQIAFEERFHFCRYIPSNFAYHSTPPSRAALRVLVVIANPVELPTFQMAPIDVRAERERALKALAGLPSDSITILDGSDGQRATLAAIGDQLRHGPQFLYLVCHGKLNGREPLLYLEREGQSRYTPVSGAEFIQAITGDRPPHLVVLGSCESAGDGYKTMAAVGPQLVRRGVGAVVAMQGQVPQVLVAEFTPRLLKELLHDGEIERAVAAARAGLPRDMPTWMPILWMAPDTGPLWRDSNDNERRHHSSDDQRRQIRRHLIELLGRSAPRSFTLSQRDQLLEAILRCQKAAYLPWEQIVDIGHMLDEIYDEAERDTAFADLCRTLDYAYPQRFPWVTAHRLWNFLYEQLVDHIDPRSVYDLCKPKGAIWAEVRHRIRTWRCLVMELMKIETVDQNHPLLEMLYYLQVSSP